ncbi:hypothetical protein RZS08_61355, partial [Arthrospira platensis SPKY1]|nr:hypothetical protein [Arthrospira platensis SPKY1]
GRCGDGRFFDITHGIPRPEVQTETSHATDRRWGMMMNAWGKRCVWAVFAGAVLAGAGCGGGSTPTADPVTDPVTDPPSPPGVVVFTAAAAPAKLSAWRLLLSD